MPDTPSSTVKVEEIRPCPDGTFNVVLKGAGFDLNFTANALMAMGVLVSLDHAGTDLGYGSAPGVRWRPLHPDASLPAGPIDVTAETIAAVHADARTARIVKAMRDLFAENHLAPADAATMWAHAGMRLDWEINPIAYIDEPGVRETMPLPPNDETAADRLYGYCHHVVEQLCLAEMEVRHVDLDDYTLLNFSRKLNSAILLVKAVGRYLRPDSNTCAIDIGVLEGTEEMVARDAADDANEIICCLAQLKPGDMMIEHLIGRARYWVGAEQPAGEPQVVDVRPEPSRTVAFEDLYRYAPIIRRADTLYHAVQWRPDKDSESATRLQQVKTFVDEHSVCDFSIHRQTTTDRLIIRRHDRSVPITMEMGEWLIVEVETGQLTVLTPAEYNARYCEAP